MKKFTNMNLTLDGNSVEKKREEIKNYFLNTYLMYEKIFELLKNDSVFYKKSEPTRHPMLFYLGHTATFFINKLVNMKIIVQRIDKNFESIFAVGVDEMSWDDTNSTNYIWPKVSEVREYRKKVKNLVLKLIDNLEFFLPISWDSPMWIILMGIEHENIHIETSLVLHRQMPLEYINQSDKFNIFQKSSNKIKNSMIIIPSCNIVLGKPNNHHLYGWDNEYGKYKQYVDKFETSKYLVCNEEYIEFVNDKGYETMQYWCEDGIKFLKEHKIKHPPFWIKIKDGYNYRAINKIIPLPLDWPVDVNALEAKAFCKYRSIKENKNYALPNEVQYEAIYNYANIQDKQMANEGLKYFSSVPVDIYEQNGIYDVIGNVWQWCSTPIFPFDGFKFHKAYDDFTVPIFDNKHALLNGSSWASIGNLRDKYSRYAFREHFYQNAGFRYILDNKKEKVIKNNIYETNNTLFLYCEFQYGDKYFGVENFSIAVALIAKQYIKNTKKALDIGCATGRLSFELAKLFDKVDGIDFSARFIQVGTALKNNKIVQFKDYEEGDIYKLKSIDIKSLGYENIKDKVSFWQGDACNLKINFNSYDCIIGTNLIDRLYEPRLFLNEIKNRLNSGGILILTSPYTWQQKCTKKENWLGGYIDDFGNKIDTLTTLKKIFQNDFNLLDIKDVPFVIKETNRKYQHTISQLTIWRKL
jgi:5-histidylcysteine sulfoxide synthase/putative 4-mercaptohistidine N1-methyltranferase